MTTRSTIEGGRGCNNFVPVLRGNGTKIAPTGDIFDQPPGGMSWIRGKLADHVGGHVVLSPEKGVLVTSSGTESSYPCLPQALNNSEHELVLLFLPHTPKDLRVGSAFPGVSIGGHSTHLLIIRYLTHFRRLISP